MEKLKRCESVCSPIFCDCKDGECKLHNDIQNKTKIKQQTSVDWLHEKIKETYNREGKLPLAYILDLVIQAKAKEKEQTIGLLKWMNKIASETPMRLETDLDDIVEQYYNETYKNK